MSHGLVSKVLAKTSLPASNVLEILASDRRSSNIVKMVESLRARAFLCINNLVQALSVEDLGGPGSKIIFAQMSFELKRKKNKISKIKNNSYTRFSMKRDERALSTT